MPSKRPRSRRALPAGRRIRTYVMPLPVAVLAWSLASCAAPGGPPAPSLSARPNIVFILADDLGWRDLGCTGHPVHRTPNLDRLAAQGMRFTQAYSACTVCSPTRAGILTGRYPARLHVTDWIPGKTPGGTRLLPPAWTPYLPLEEVTLAEALRPAGYVSAGIGKWHLGSDAYYPERQGFDLNVGGSHQGQPPSYFTPYGIPTLPDGPPGEYLTDRLTDEAVRFIRSNRERPFFLYLPYHAVHKPLQAKKEKIETYRGAAGPAAPRPGPLYAAMVESLDEGVGRVLREIETLGLAERTLVVFTSDNGGLIGVTTNPPLRDGKGSVYEGGVRVPLLAAWPGRIPAGRTCDEPVISVDFFPTILELAGTHPDPARVIDGVNLVPLLRETGGIRREALYWHYPHYHTNGAPPYGAIRQGDFRLVEFYEDGRLELYDLRRDIGEAKNLAAEHPEKAQALRKMLADWREAVGAQMPTANPDYVPAR